MSYTKLIKNATIVNEGKSFIGSVLIEGEKIKSIFTENITVDADEVFDASGLHLIPGVIDDQVHFREPGLTHKATIETESKAAVAGGITTFMEMPNTVPNALTQDLLQDKYDIAAESSYANYSFFMGASNNNLDEVLKTDSKNVCGVKVFMGSSTGNMLVDNQKTLEGLFKESPTIIASHCEDEAIIRANTALFKEKFGEDVPMKYHPIIRSEEACYKSSSMAAELAHKCDAHLHILHISTAKELSIFDHTIPMKQKNVTAEACVHHLWFSDEQYETKGSYIKWNPAVKTSKDRASIFQGVLDNKIDVIATDHAPHTLEEKNNSYFKAPSGGPLVQHALPSMLDHFHNGKISLEKVVEKMCHAVAELFDIKNRGFIKEGYQADLVLVDLNKSWPVTKENILYKCGWSPFEGHTFKSSVIKTFINGNLAFDSIENHYQKSGQRVLFNR